MQNNIYFEVKLKKNVTLIMKYRVYSSNGKISQRGRKKSTNAKNFKPKIY